MNRASGVLMHVSTLWGQYSEGSFGMAAREWIDFLEECGFSYWQTLPFCLPDEMNSPYKSYSSFSGNPNFIDLPLLCKEGLISEQELEEAKQNISYACEFDRLRKERLALLTKASIRARKDDIYWNKVVVFLDSHKETAEFCRYMALKSANGDKAWTEWEITRGDEEVLTLWQFCQYVFFTQWAEIKSYANSKGISIIGDIPIYVAWDSADVWSAPENFLLDEKGEPSCVAGVPPDYFCEDGQLWGNPIYNWKAMKKDGYSWWKRRMSFMLEAFDGVRIDHFRGLQAYFTIPAGEKTARNGKWVNGPGMSLIKELKSVCGDKLIIAEDLGEITDDVRTLVKKSGFPGMKVMQFAFLGERDSLHLPHNYPENCVAYTGTHDNNTLLGYVWDMDEQTRRWAFDYCGYHGNELDASYDYFIRTLFASHASLVIVPVQDLLLYGSDTRLNKPGVAEGNWAFRVTKEQIESIDKEKYKKLNRLYVRK